MRLSIRHLKASVAALSAVIIAGSALTVGLLTPSVAGASAIVPPWEPDANAVGGLIFFNAAGTPITSGPVSGAPIAAYVEGTSTIRAGDTKATLFGYLPVSGQTPAQFNGEALGASSTFPNASAPAPLTTSGLPVETGTGSDKSVFGLEQDFPNLDVSPTDGYADMYVLRLKTTAVNKPGNTTYDEADIEVSDTSAGAIWSVVYPAPDLTTLAATPSGPQVYGTPVTLTATVSDGAPGTVQFKNGSVNIGTPVTVSGGTASIVSSTITAGSDTLNAVFTPTAGSGLSQSNGSTPYTVTQASTDTTLSASPASPQEFGSSVTLTATVTSGVAGTVQFENGSTPIGTPVTVSGGAASTSTTTLPTGNLTLNAVFAPTDSTDYGGSTGSTPYSITAAPTSTGLVATPSSPQVFGSSVTLTATVTSGVAGTVQFENGSAPIGTPVTVSGGSAHIVTSTLPAGSLTLNAVFSPTDSTDFNGSTGSTPFTINQAPTSTSLTVTPSSPQFVGTSLTLTATVAEGLPGTVQFENGSTDIGSPVTVTAGTASIVTSTLPAGSLTLNAVFSPTDSTDYAVSTGTASFTVTPLTSTTTTLVVTPASPQFVGSALTLTATVSPSASGSVQFENGTTAIGSPVVVSGGTAAITTSTLPTGSLTLNAVYTPTAGNGFSGSTGSTAFTVAPLTATTTTVSASPASPQLVGTPITLTATVAPTASGSVQFENGSTAIDGPVAVSGGTASTTTSTLPVGTDSLSAVFTPTDGNGFSGSTGTTAFSVTGNTGKGYWLFASDGGVFTFGDAKFFGSASGVASSPIVGTATTPDGGGYWMAGSNGEVYPFGDAKDLGPDSPTFLGSPVVGIASTGTGNGYWLVTAAGGILAVGDAAQLGSLSGKTLNKPVDGIAATPDGKGYWLLGGDGGIFSFGDAQFFGSTGSLVLNKPVVGLTPTPDGKGYWLVATDGGIFSFGDAQFFGSTGSLVLNKPVVGMESTPDGNGYWLVATDGGIFSFGDASFFGSTGSLVLNKPIIGMGEA